MTTKSKVALFQMDCKFGETEVNVNKCVDAMKKAAREDLRIFPGGLLILFFSFTCGG